MDALRDTWRRVVLRQPQQLYSLAVRCTRAAARALARPAPGLGTAASSEDGMMLRA
jgi:hypothetical protein